MVRALGAEDAPRHLDAGGRRPAVPGVKVLEQIGRGRSAVVYRARRQGTEYALKVLNSGGADEEQAAASFRREAALQACVNHPGLPRVYEVGVTGRQPYLLMDLVEGRRLADLISRGPLPEDRVVALGVDVAAALDAAHRAGLVHRDVKPDNIMIGANDSARLVDFGLATHVSGAEASGAAGTLLYAAPEQSGVLNRRVDGRADLYALGAVLFEAATGRPPFVADDVGELLRMHASVAAPDPRDLRPGLSADLVAIMVRLLAKDPDDRYASAASLRADLLRPSVTGAFDPIRPIEADTGPGPASDDLPLVGRVAEAEQLASRWARALGGAGGCALVDGSPGAGKSRLAREVMAPARSAGHPVLYGKDTDGQARPLAVLRAAVDGFLAVIAHAAAPEQQRMREWLVRAGGPVAPLLTTLSADLGAVLGAVAAEVVDDDQFTDAVATFLADFAHASGGAILYLDEVHRLDDVTLAVLRQLAPKLPGTPLLVLAAGRDDPDSRAGLDAFRAVLGTAIDLTVSLRPLVDAEVGVLVANATGGLTVDAGTATRLTAHCQGNPFTVLEYLKAIVDAGLMRPSWGSWDVDLDGLGRLDLPADAALLLLKRVDALDRQSRGLLAIGALLGHRFDPGLLAETVGVERERVHDLLADAAWHRLVQPADGCYEFLHDRIREALVNRFTPAARRAAHQRIADVLTQRDASTPAAVYALADHCLRGETNRDPDRVFRAATAAGVLALADHAALRAVSYLERAEVHDLAGAHRADPGWLRTMGTAYHRGGRFADAVAAFRAAHALSTDRLERADLLRLVALAHDNTWQTADQVRAVHQALAELGRPLPRNSVLLLLSTVWMMLIGFLIGRTKIGYGTARGETRAVFRTLTALYTLYSTTFVRDQRMHHGALACSRVTYYANRLGVSSENARATGERALVNRSLGLRRLPDRQNARAMRMARELDDPRTEAYCAWIHGVAMFGSGQDDGETTRRVMEQHGRWMELGHYLDCFSMLAWDLVLRGDTVEAETWIGRRRARAAASGQFGGVATLPVEAGPPTLRGQVGAVAELLSTFRALTDLPVASRLDLIIATMQAAIEQQELDTVFDDAVREFEGLGLSPLGILPALQPVYVYQAYGRVEQLRGCAEEDRPARLAAARAALAQLRRVRHRPLIAAFHGLLGAALHEAAGDPRTALAALAKAEPLFLAVDAPRLAFESALVRARALRAIDVPGEASRQAELALGVASAQGWWQRASRIRTEFDLAAPHAGSVSIVSTGDVVAAELYRKRLAALEQVSLASSRVLDPDRLARIAVDETIRILGAERALLFLVDGESGRLGLRLGRDSMGGDLTEMTGYSRTLVDRVEHDRQPIVVGGADEGEALGSESARLHGLRSIIIAPLRLNDRLLGVIYLDSRVAKGIFTTDDIGILTAITNQVAVALETARAAQLEVAVTAMERQRDLAETLRAAMNEVSGTLDPDAVLQTLARAALRLVGGQRRWLVSPDDLLAKAHPDPSITTGEPVTGAVVDEWAAEFGEPDDELASWLWVPLFVRAEPVGSLVLASSRPNAYGPAEVETVGAIVAQGLLAYENARLFSQLSMLANVDGLTQMANRRHFLEIAEQTLTEARLYDQPLAAIMVDIDNFKRINDTYGHQAGDDVIRTVAARLNTQSRDVDVVGRYGGEEFVLILPDVGDAGPDIAERLRAGIEATPVDTVAGPVNVTISVGLAELSPSDADLGALLARADEYLYRAKRSGRNRVSVYEREGSGAH